jgi:hypothetical protein
MLSVRHLDQERLEGRPDAGEMPAKVGTEKLPPEERKRRFLRLAAEPR